MVEGEAPWINIVRADYRLINPTCERCSEDSTVIAIRVAVDGEMFISTMCDEHAKGEVEHIVSVEKFIRDGERSTYYSSKVLERAQNMPEKDRDAAVKFLNDAAGIEVHDFREEGSDAEE